MVNDDCRRKANCIMTKLVVKGVPKLFLYAVKDICAGDELKYDYGVPGLPWRHIEEGDCKPVLYPQPSKCRLFCYKKVQSDQSVVSRVHLVEVRGKCTRGIRKVFVLLTPDMVAGIQHLLRTRIYAGVSPENHFKFGRTNASPLDGCTAMRVVTESCPSLVRPELIRSRLLRKYLATTSQIMDMTGNELKLVVNHMGHSVAIHTDIYKLQSSILERPKLPELSWHSKVAKWANLRGRRWTPSVFEELPEPTAEEEDVAELETETEMDCELHVPVTAVTMDLHVDDGTVDEGCGTSQRRLQGVKRKRWTLEEDHCILKAFKVQIDEKTNLTTDEIRTAIKLFPGLKERTEAVIRSKVNNIILGKVKGFGKK